MNRSEIIKRKQRYAKRSRIIRIIAIVVIILCLFLLGFTIGHIIGYKDGHKIGGLSRIPEADTLIGGETFRAVGL